jgi:phenylacetate-CoA ligase
MAGHVLEFAASSTLERQRLEGLRDVLEYVKSESPLYERKLSGFDLRSIQSLEDVPRLPFTTRSDLQDAAPFGSLCKSARPEAYYESSGTSGTAVPGFPDLSPEKARSFAQFLDLWLGLSRSRISRALVAFAYEMNPAGVRFQTALPYVGVMAIPVGVRTTICSPEKTLDYILRLGPQVIFGRPLELLRYGDALAARGTPPAQTQVLKLFFIGEVVSKAKWHRLQMLWDDADLYGHYGLVEVDSGLQTCHCGNYHEPPSPFLLTEIIEPATGQPVEAGRWGEVVFTTLRRTHAPLVRYRTSDSARRLPHRCACGDPSPVYEVRGRLLDGYTAEGRTVFPIDLENVIYGHSDIGNEYLFVIEPDDSLRLILERSLGSERDCNAEAARVAADVRATLGITVSVEVRPFGAIADKLGIAKKKSGRFTDLRGLDAEGCAAELEINVVNSERLRTGGGFAISI